MSCVPRILVVHDEPAVCELLVRILGDAGYSVVPVSDGPSILAAAGNGALDLIITNSYAPDVPADLVIRHLRQLFPQVPIFHLDRLQPFSHDALVASVALAVEERFERPA